jgi:hypothetical protein
MLPEAALGGDERFLRFAVFGDVPSVEALAIDQRIVAKGNASCIGRAWN